MNTIQLPQNRSELKKGILPSPSFRHAAPSAPWPWVDIDDGINEEQKALMRDSSPAIPKRCEHDAECRKCWERYPKALFPNWTESQVLKSGIANEIKNKRDCVCYFVDVDDKGWFTDAIPMCTKANETEEMWQKVLHTEPPQASTRAIFIQDLSGPMLQMLGTKYNIEPFFFSSSLNWIPSRFQSDMEPGVGDHITITLTFLRSVSDINVPRIKHHPQPKLPFRKVSFHGSSLRRYLEEIVAPPVTESIDTKSPLALPSCSRHLCLDLLSVHLMRKVKGSTIISYHPSVDLPTTAAEALRDRIQYAGQSVYWQKMFQASKDPSLILLVFLWHALYSWDQALEHLYSHICSMESTAIDSQNWEITQDLHIIRAHQLFYSSLLRDLEKSVEFIRKTKNPALKSAEVSKEERKLSTHFMERECDNIKLEVDRLVNDLSMQEKRLKNVMNLVFSSVNISDSNLMKEMTQAAVKDSAAMKQIAYLTMVFLPASFVAAVFGMNVTELETDGRSTIGWYAAFAVPLTLCTIWVIIAFQIRYLLKERTFFERLGWPWFLLKAFLKRDNSIAHRQSRIVMIQQNTPTQNDHDEEQMIGGRARSSDNFHIQSMH